MKTRLMTALAAVTLLLVTMPGLAVAAKPDPQLTLTPNVQYCDGPTAYLEVDATWNDDVKGPEVHISLVAQVRYDGSTFDAGSGTYPTANDGAQTGVWSQPVEAAHPDTELFVQGWLVRKNGDPISAEAEVGWFGCSG